MREISIGFIVKKKTIAVKNFLFGQKKMFMALVLLMPFPKWVCGARLKLKSVFVIWVVHVEVGTAIQVKELEL